jgi:hypothetical protein
LTAPARALLLGAGLLAMGLVQETASASATPPAPAPSQLQVGAAGDGLLIRVQQGTILATPRHEDDASVDDDEGETVSTTAESPAVAGSRDYRWTAADVLYVRDRASSRARCIIDREVGGFGYDPWRRGAAGERGPVQLHPRGLLAEYLAWSGGQAPENPYYAVPFLEYKLRQGQGRHWSPVRLGLC